MSDPPSGLSRFEQRSLIYIAIPRVLALPLFFGFLLLTETTIDAAVVVVAAIALAYVLGTLLIATGPRWNRIDPRWYIPADLVVMGAAMLVTGGPSSAVQGVFYVWAIAISMIFPPRIVLMCAVGAMATCAVTSIPFVLDDSDELRQLGIVMLTLAWICLVTYLVADAFERREARIGRLSEARRSLLADALSAEDRARRRLSQSLHDHVLQTLLAAGQDLDDAMNGDRTRLERAREDVRGTVRELRGTIRGLHPAALEHGGLAGGLDAVVESASGRGGFAADLRVDPEAGGVHDALIVSVVRELMTNVVKHAEADRVAVQVNRTGEAVVVDVDDDGRGMTDSGREAALSAGHIGLPSTFERVEAAGGSMAIASAPGRGTKVRVTLPLLPDPQWSGPVEPAARPASTEALG